MGAGAPGDHPISDILHWKVEVYGAMPDEEFRALALLLSRRELEEWWLHEIGWEASSAQATTAIHEKLLWARQRAKENGWE